MTELGELGCAHRPSPRDRADGIPRKDAKDEEAGERHGEQADEGASDPGPDVATGRWALDAGLDRLDGKLCPVRARTARRYSRSAAVERRRTTRSTTAARTT